MKRLGSIQELLARPGVEDEEQKLVALALPVIALALLSGLSLLVIYRILTGRLNDVLPEIVLSLMVAASLLLLRHGRTGWSGGLLTWSALGFLQYMIWKNDGLHDTAMVAIPGVLVLASITLKRKYYAAVTSVTLLSIAVLGNIEIIGRVRNGVVMKTTPLDVLDLMVIVGTIAITVRVLSDALFKSLITVTNSERELKEQATRLRASEDRYRTLFEGANDAILIISGETFVDCNAMSLTMFGCADREDIIGRAPWELSPALQPDGGDSKERALAIMRNAMDGESQRFLWRHSRKDGTLFDAEVSLSRLDAGHETLIQALVRDVTEHKQMEDRLKKSEEHYRTLVETSPEAVVIVDVEGRLVFASQKAYDLFRVARDCSIAGQSITRWVAPEHQAIVRTRLAEALGGTTQPQSGEFRLLREDRTEFWGETASAPLYDARGLVTGLLVVCRDISERKAAEKALRESEERFSRLSDASFEGIVLTEKGRIIDLNDRLAAMFQRTRSEMIGMHVASFVAPESMERVLEHQRSASEDPYEHVALRSDGTRFPVEIHAKSITVNGASIRLTAIRDITWRKEAEKQLRSSLQEKEMLLKEIHHRVKNNMQVISSLLNLGTQKINDPAGKEILRASMNRIRSMALVHETLYKSENMADIDFNEYLRGMTSWLVQGSGRLGVTCMITGDSIHLSLDTAIPCGLIVNELVSNALKHAFNGRDNGSINIVLRREHDGRVTLIVSDDGIGFPQDADIRAMTSLGMTLVFSLVDQISGTITIDGTHGASVAVSFQVHGV